MRVTLFAHGIVFPCILLVMSLNGFEAYPDEPWQSGEFLVYVAMLLRPAAWLPFAPAIAFSIISLATWTIAPAMGKRLWVRIGVYSGVVLASHYLILLFPLFHLFLIVSTAIVLPSWHLGLWLLHYLYRRCFIRRQFSMWHIMVLMTLAVIPIMLYLHLGVQFFYFPITFLSLAIPATPILNVFAYGIVATSLAESDARHEAGSKKYLVLGLGSWLLGWLLAWRLAIVAMLDEYSKLPTTNPNCYLSNAASFAHPRLTRAARRGDVTLGMRRLKFLEVVLQLAMPKLHGCIRRHYDRFCPPLARYCQLNTWLATATCILLMPLELIAIALQLILRIERAKVDAIYSGVDYPFRSRQDRADV